jgi:glycosyltransferase involved in cell wall biosynthesis
MNIAIDISPLDSQHKKRGIGIYTARLVEALQKYESTHSYMFFSSGQPIPKNVDVVHYPYFDPFFLTLPIGKHPNTVVTVHDLIPLVFPHEFPPGIRGSIKWVIQKRSLKGAKRIITDSNASKKDIARIVGFPEASIDTVYLAPSLPEMPSSDINLFLKRYELPKKYFLYVGDVNWNKNIIGLLTSFAEFQKIVGSKDVLVLAGGAFLKKDVKEVSEIHSFIRSHDLEQYVRMPGFIEESDLPLLYTQAFALIQPSYAEGFGLPVLEAMQLGCPVVSSNTSSLAEIIGPSLVINPYDVQNMASGLMKMNQLSKQERDNLIIEGKKWASQFSWKRVAHETVAVYSKMKI